MPKKINRLGWIVIWFFGFFMLFSIAIAVGDIFVKPKAGRATTKPQATAPTEVKLPDWLPAYPGASAKALGMHTSSPEDSGLILMTTSDSPHSVIDFYQNVLKKAGVTDVTNTIKVGPGSVAGMLIGKSPDDKRHAQILFGIEGGKTSATITYASRT